MFIVRYFSTALFFYFYLVVGQEEPCPASYPRSCKCTPNWKEVKCENMDIFGTTKFPRVFSKDTESLTLEKSRIENITREDFKNLTKLRTLTMKDGWLENIEEGTFQQLQNLTRVALTNNGLETRSFPKGAFSNLTKLKSVWLTKNYIRVLPEDIFMNTPVETLSMAYNQLDVPGLRGIGSGRVATSLKHLLLSGTSLHRFTTGEFSGLPNLKLLGVVDCNIHYIHTDFLKGTKVTRIDLKNNPIVKIDADAMRGDQITDFSCRHCGLTNEKVFGKDSFFKQMTSLDRLDLGFNEITHVPKDAFMGMTKLRTLLLFYNNISTIEENPFAYVPKASLGIQENPFHCDCHLAWFHEYALKNLGGIVKHMKCASPTQLAEKRFEDLSSSQFCYKATANTTAVSGFHGTGSVGPTGGSFNNQANIFTLLLLLAIYCLNWNSSNY